MLLDLSGNRIDDQAVALLCQGLAINDALRILKVSRQTGYLRAPVFTLTYKNVGSQFMLKFVLFFCSALPQPANKYWSSDAAQNGYKQPKISIGGDGYFCKCRKLHSPQRMNSIKKIFVFLMELHLPAVLLYFHDKNVHVWVQTVFVCETFMGLLEETRHRSPALSVQYRVMTSVVGNIHALNILQVSSEDKSGDGH